MSRAGSTEVVQYVYDAAYRVIGVRDGKGNLTSFAYNTRGDLTRITYPGGDTLRFESYDSAGRLEQRIDGRGIPTNYTYNDPEGLLTDIQYVQNGMTAYGNVLTAGYNGDGLRAWKQTATGRRYYLYDGEELACELDAAGNVAAPVLFGANGLIVYSGYIYQFDPQGNAVHLLDDDGRTVLANLAYDAWGQLISGSNPTPYGYKGQWGYYTDVESGILLLTHRYLDPATGRFLTRDPIGVEGGVNLYAYVGNGVVVKADPRGTFAIVPYLCAACVGCLAGFALPCVGCGLNLSCWKQCLSDVWQRLPTWLKAACGVACAGCVIGIIKPPILRPSPRPMPLPGPGDKPVKPEPGCPDRHEPSRNYWLCIKHCRANCAYCRDDFEEYRVCFIGCMNDCLDQGFPPGGYRPVVPE